MSNSEVISPRKRIVLSEYGQSVATELLKSDEVTSKNGIVYIDELDDEDHQLANNIRDAGTKIEILELKKGGIQIKANSRVGHVAFKNFDLVIRPKFEYLARQQDPKRSPLATLLAYAFDFEDINRIGEQISLETYFADILIHGLLEKIRDLQCRGLFQQYRKEYRDLSVIRGKIDLKTWLRRGGIPSETMPCVFYHRSLDNILNQTLCAGLRRSVAIANSDTLKNECRYLADTFALDGITEKTLDYRLLTDARRGLTRLNAHYENAINIVQMLYEGSGGFVLGNSHREPIRIPGFFFDMNVLFETVIGKFLTENLPPEEYEVGLQNQNIRPVYQYVGEKKHYPPPIKPDIIVSKNNGEQFVLDTKYKDIGSEIDENANTGKGNPSTADLYQLSVYALTCSRHQEEPMFRARIVYPAKNSHKRKIDLRRNENNLCTITLFPIDLVALAETIAKGEKKEQKELALKIIGEKKIFANVTNPVNPKLTKATIGVK